MADYDEEKNSGEKDMRGWVQMLPFFLEDNVKIDNAAKNGRSSKSFYYQFWDELRESIKPGDYVFIQFGHNDEKGDGLDTEDKPGERGTAAWGQYQKYLSIYVNDSRERGANPVLFTPVVRRLFDENRQIKDNGLHNLSEISGNDSLMNYPKAMIALGRELSVPVVDMTSLTETLVESYGAEKAKQIIYANNDNTHLKAMGGILFSELAVKELWKQSILTDYISLSSGFSVKPANYDFGVQFEGKSSIKSFSLVGLDLIPDSGVVHITVNEPFQLTNVANGEFGQNISVSYNEGVVNSQLFVKFTPKQIKDYEQDMVVLSDGAIRQTVALQGSGVSTEGSKALQFDWINKAENKEGIRVKIEGLIFADYPDMGMLLTTPDGLWPAGDIDVNTSRYIEFSILASDGDLYIDSVKFDMSGVGGKEMYFTALGSTDSNFRKSETFAAMELLKKDSMQTYTFDSVIKVEKGQTFYLRIYPWYKRAAEGKFIKLNKVTFNGLLFSQE